MADVFISYSRRDAEFVDHLASSLKARGKMVWLDTEGIADAEVFTQALRTAIEESDAFLFVITPASVVSRFCHEEITYARSLEKRIVPLLRERVPDSTIPEEIRQRNWIPIAKSDPFDAGLDRVISALDTDLELRKQHTRWLLKAIEWDSEERDASFLLRGSELQAAEQWLAGVSVDADPAPTTVQREYVLASRQAAARRQRRLVALSLAVAAVAITLGIVALISRDQARSAQVTARSRALAAQSETALSTDPETSVLLARRAVSLASTPEAIFALRQAIDSSFVRRALPTEAAQTCGFESGPAVAYSPNGRQLAESLCNGDVVLHTTASGHITRRRRVSSKATAVAYSPNGSLLAVGTDHGIDLLDPSTGMLRTRLSAHGEPNALAFSPDGALIAATAGDGTTLWNLATGEPRDLRTNHNTDRTLAFTSDGRQLAVGTNENVTAVIDLATGQTVQSLATGSQDSGLGSDPIAIGQHGQLLAVGTNGVPHSTVTLWNTTTWTQTASFTTISGTNITSLAVSPDGTRLAVGGGDGTGGVWSLQPNEELVPILGQTALIETISFSPDGEDVVTSSDDGTSRIYQAHGPGLAAIASTPCSCGNEIALRPNSLTSLDQSGDATIVHTWPLPTRRACFLGQQPNCQSTEQFVLTRAPFAGQALSPDGTLAAVWSDLDTTGPTLIWNIAEKQVIRTLPALGALERSGNPGSTMGSETVSFSTDDKLVALRLGTGTDVRVVSLIDGRTFTASGYTRLCSGVGGPPAISRDDRFVASDSACGQVVVRSASTGRRVAAFSEAEQLCCIAFNPDGSRLAVASTDSSVSIWSVRTHRPLLHLIGHTRGITDVLYSPNGRLIATTSADHTLRIWDANTGRLLRVNHDLGFTWHPAFSPDGRSIAENDGEDGVTRVWDTCTACDNADALGKLSRSAVVSPLTRRERTESAAG